VEVFGIQGIQQHKLFHILSVVTFSLVPGFVSVDDFAQIYTNFGEKNGLFPKLIATLNSRLVTDGLLVFESIEEPIERGDRGKVYFSLGSNFGFVIVCPDRTTKHVRNEFEIPFFSQWIVDADGTQYQAWEEVLARCGC
jgi:hypothetical protein